MVASKNMPIPIMLANRSEPSGASNQSIAVLPIRKCKVCAGAQVAFFSFLSLPVIPELKLTDKGLMDVRALRLVGLFGERE